MILCINTKDQKKVTVALKINGKMVESLSEKNEYGSQVLLPLIEKLLKKYSTKLPTKNVKNPQVSIQFHPPGGPSPGGHLIWEILEGIEVETGPGSFTGLRVGVSVANALGYSLGIPVNRKTIETGIQY